MFFNLITVYTFQDGRPRIFWIRRVKGQGPGRGKCFQWMYFIAVFIMQLISIYVKSQP